MKLEDSEFEEWWAKVEEVNPPEVLAGCKDLAYDAWDYQQEKINTIIRDNEQQFMRSCLDWMESMAGSLSTVAIVAQQLSMEAEK